MTPWIADQWKEYELLDTGDGERLERWGKVVLRRPDPQVIWPRDPANESAWKSAHAHYHRSASGGGSWEILSDIPDEWTLRYKELSFKVRPTGFKHTGLFPEQAVNWDWMQSAIRAAGRPIRLLNLFAYTGAATVAAAAAGAEVAHVDAAKGMVQWAKENLALSGLADKPVRFLVDDALKFVNREQRRGNRYDAILMDPPSYGRGSGGEQWKLESSLYPLVEACAALLSDKPLFFQINSYTTGLAPSVLGAVLTLALRGHGKGNITTGEIGLPVSRSGLILPCGIVGRWEVK